ncbi:galactokinase [Nocardioides sp. T5]|uniref:galactokinase n=1 Tax=Nocardioides sp. T5 TaxID=3400182 RepID=UPI003A85C21A
MTDVPTPVSRARAAFRKAFAGAEPDGCWWAPGRVNLIGEHTDYNDGFVLPLALAQGVAAAVRVRADDVLRVHSRQEDSTRAVRLADVGPGTVEGWLGYVAGVGWALAQRGVDVRGLDVAVDGNIPIGAGLSSSAALECAVALAWNDLGGFGLDRNALAAAARRAENDIVGAPTGVMDQMASLHGRAGSLMFLDTRSLGIDQVPFDLAAHGLALLVIDSRAPHALVDGEYAERRASCTRGAEALGVTALRDVGVAELDDALARLSDDTLRRRVRHVVTENERVLEVVRLLSSGADPREIGPLMTRSHASMRYDFEITVPQVDTAAEAALTAGAYGARMTGGGFGGCVLALVDADADAVTNTEEAVARAYADAGFRPPTQFVAAASDGARRVTMRPRG